MRKTRRSQALITEGSRSNERSWIVSTAGHGQPGGITCRKWASSGRTRRSSRGRRQAIRSSWLPAGSDSGSTPGRDERRVARHRREAKVGRDARQRAQELAHVGLVAGAAAAEDVGVDDDHAAASR